jgi:hypothetical protein
MLYMYIHVCAYYVTLTHTNTDLCWSVWVYMYVHIRAYYVTHTHTHTCIAQQQPVPPQQPIVNENTHTRTPVLLNSSLCLYTNPVGALYSSITLSQRLRKLSLQGKQTLLLPAATRSPTVPPTRRRPLRKALMMRRRGG